MDIKGSLRRAFMTTVAASALFVSARAQTQVRDTVTTSNLTTTTNGTVMTAVLTDTLDTIPWHKDPFYIKEMQDEYNKYASRVESIRANEQNQITHLNGNTTMNNTNMWTWGTISIPRVVSNSQQTKVNNNNKESQTDQIQKNADTYVQNEEVAHTWRMKAIENNYKSAYLRDHPEYGKSSVDIELKNLDKQIELTNKQILLQQKQAQLQKLQGSKP